MLRLRCERLQRGWSQTELAARARMHTQQVSAIENGMMKPYPSQLARLARALDVPEDEAASLLEEVQAGEGR